MNNSTYEVFQDKFVLIVEPTTSTRTKLVKAFNSIGIHVLAAECAKDALEMVDHFKVPALAIIELVLPDMTGVQLATTLCEVYPCPIIFTTSNPEPSQIAKLLDLVADDVVCKPCDAREVAARAARILERRHRQSQFSNPPPINRPRIPNQRRLREQPMFRQ
ncbi:MAG: response regulator [Caldilineaceae bacterium]